VGNATSQAAAIHGQLLAFHDAFFAAVIIGIIGFLCAFLIHDEDAADTMHPSKFAGAEKDAVPVH
jgi:hypothetical protein